ncbi:MAG: CoB--CoM heterodisulfide reductase iron-sulfur subunit A family protein [Deltaproteobacteria bacterium]|nr:CoB--CoM heterodisulfide reductase iron-sulfur subunit A family protein [Deltaproteobacteria bacterium]
MMPEEVQTMQTCVSAADRVGTVMVIGAGVSGIQAALDAAGSGFKVYLVDKGPAIGGRMSQLDKTFPTNDCSMCILSPKFIECATNPNITIMTNTRIESVEGEAGAFEAHLVREPRYVDETLCTGCGTCAEYCPINILDVYNERLGTQKCIHVHFPQAVPAVSIVDPAQCLFLLRTECQICVPTCRNKAIDFHQQPERLTLEAGSLILAPGYEPFDPELQSQYGYHRFSNVVTSLEFERLISASGPNGGELARPSDGKVPQRIAWIQCVGSRDEAAGCTYCSAVCCMYATKQVILSKEHHPEIEAVVLHNDIRAYGKGFERYYERAKNMDGVRYVWSKASILEERPETGGVVVRYRINGTEVRDEEFDLVVLSIGLTSGNGNRELSEKLAVEVNSHGFCESPPFSPIETSRRGIFNSGVFHAPMDIPDAVTMASGAASLASQLLADVRGTRIQEKVYPEERDVRGEPPRIGVFVCDCGTNVAKVVNVPAVADYARGLNGVIHAVEETFACSVDAVTHMVETIREKKLNRIVVAACTPRTHEPVFQDALREAGLNPYLFEFANIREHCSLVHMREKEAATEKAKDLVRMAVCKALLLEPLYQVSYPLNRSALVVGGGVAGMMSSLALARQGIRVHLVEKAEALGGLSLKIPETLEGWDVRSFVRDLVDQVGSNPLIGVRLGAELVDFSGYVGNFSSRIRVGRGGDTEEIAHGVTVVATGAEEARPTEYLYGEDDRVLTLLELDDAIERDRKRFETVGAMVFIQCVGSRDENRPYCSRVCCSHSIMNALKLKKTNPQMEIYVLYRDMRTYGLREDYYKKASDLGVIFIRYDVDDKPLVEAVEEEGRPVLRVTVTEPILGQRLVVDADGLCLAAASVPPAGTRSLSHMLKVPQNEDGFFLEAHMKLRPVDFSTEGIFMCGTAHSPKFIDESIAQAQAAASRAMTILAREEMKAGGPICLVNALKCVGCGVCQQVCPYGAIALDAERGTAEVNPALCKGCGVCAASCRSGALDVAGVNDEQTLLMIRSISG